MNDSQALRVRNLQVGLAGLDPIVRGVDIDVDLGGSLGIVGESGSGKSLTVRAIAGLIPKKRWAVDGSIELLGIDTGRISRSRLRTIQRRHLGLVFQDPLASLHPVRTIGSQLSELLAVNGQMHGEERRKRGVAILEGVGLDAERCAASYPAMLSGGMRQRVMIGMALALSPEVLVADEPTTALDPTVQSEILQLIKAMREAEGLTLILVSHDLAVVADMCEQVIVMHNGRVVEAGPTDQVVTNPVHPYTRSLVRAYGGAGASDDEANSVSEVSGCSYAQRCEFREARCLSDEPPLFAVGEGHSSACWVFGSDG